MEPRPRVGFLGDVGSYLLGASIAALAVAGFLSGVYVEYVLSPILVYAADTGYTLLRRIKAGERWYASHREHVYQRLTDVGFTICSQPRLSRRAPPR